MRILLLIAIFFLNSCFSYTSYTKNEKQWLGGMWTACGLDIYQKEQIDKSSKFEEGNGIVEKNPELSLIGVPLVLTVIGLWMKPDQRLIWFKTFTGVKSAAVCYNYEKGVR